MVRQTEADDRTDEVEVEVVRHGVDKHGDAFTSTFRLAGAEGGELKIAMSRNHGSGHPPKNTYTPAEFVEAGYHLKADCVEFDDDGCANHLRGDFDGDFDALPSCDRPVHSFSSTHDDALDG